jgi:hypothetical protein
MSDYIITGQCNDPNARLVILNESDWVVEIDEATLPNYDLEFRSYSAEVTAGDKLVFVKRPDGSVSAYGGVAPIYSGG